MAMDSPDYQNVIVLTSGGGVTDAPDWQEVVTGPGGTQPVVSGGASWQQVWATTGLLGVSLNPMFAFNGTTGLLGGQTYLVPFAAMASGTATKIYVPASGTAVITSATSFCGLYDFGQHTAGTMTLLATSAVGDFATTIGSNTAGFTTISPGVALTGGQVYIAALQFNGGGPAAFGVTGTSTFPATPNFVNAPLWSAVGSPNGPMPTTILFSTPGRTLRNPLVYIG